MTSTWKKRSRWIVASVAVLSVLVLALRPQPVTVEVALVTRGKFEQTVDEDGKTRVRERYTVSAPLEGRLERIQLKAGDTVDQGMVLAAIYPKAPALLDVRTAQELRERVGAAEAAKRRAQTAVERAQTALDQARVDYERTRALAVSEVVAPARRERDELAVKLATKDLHAAQFEDHAAAHEVDLARAGLLRVQHRVKGTTPADQRWEIRSPVPGRVLRVLQENEGVVAVGTPLLELADPSDLEVVVDVLTTDAVQIQPGAKVWFERWGGGAAIEGRVRLVEPSAFTKVSALGVEEQRVNVVIDIVSPSEQWKAVGDGYRVDARIVVFNKADAVKIPTSALFREGDEWAVFVIADSRAHKRPIQVERRSGLEAVVATGLAPGEKIIVYPSDAVQDGVQVEIR